MLTGFIISEAKNAAAVFGFDPPVFFAQEHLSWRIYHALSFNECPNFSRYNAGPHIPIHLHLYYAMLNLHRSLIRVGKVHVVNWESVTKPRSLRRLNAKKACLLKFGWRMKY
jgi:hypothetical protein